MSVSGFIALIACVSSILAKIILSVRLKGLERLQEAENDIYQAAKNELHAALQKHERLVAETKQFESKRKAIQRNIKNTDVTLKELQTRKREDDAVRAYQKDLLKGKSR
jgi:hypothetical protein